MARRSVPRSQRQYVMNSLALRIARDLPSVAAGPFPGFIAPALATLADTPRSGERWVHEVKFDGYRLQVHARDAGLRAYTRRGYDWSDKFRPILAAGGRLTAHAVVLDGEVVVETPEGRSDFGALEVDLGAGRADRLVYYAFDLL